jgi:hypothetical protein
MIGIQIGVCVLIRKHYYFHTDLSFFIDSEVIYDNTSEDKDDTYIIHIPRISGPVIRRSSVDELSEADVKILIQGRNYEDDPDLPGEDITEYK